MSLKFLLLAAAETVITSDISVRGGKTINLKKTVDAAVESCPCVKRVFVANRSGGELSLGKKDISLDQVCKKCLQEEFRVFTIMALEKTVTVCMLFTL